MRVNKMFFVAFVASLLLSSLAFGQAAVSKGESSQTQDSTKAAIKEGKGTKLDAKSKSKNKPSTPSSKKSNYKPKDVPEVGLTDARITYDHNQYDFGSVPPGAKIVHNFPVTNTGPDTLYITKIKAG